MINSSVMEESASPSPASSSAYTKRPLWHWIALYAVIGVIIYAGIYYLFLAKKGGYGNTSAPVSEAEVQPEAAIALSSSGFNPPDLTVSVGTKVTWINTSGSQGNISSAPHPAHTDYPALNLGDFDNDASVILVFDKPGTYKYHNHLNPSQTGSITVE